MFLLVKAPPRLPAPGAGTHSPDKSRTHAHTCDEILLLSSDVQRDPAYGRGGGRVDKLYVLVGSFEHLEKTRVRKCQGRPHSRRIPIRPGTRGQPDLPQGSRQRGRGTEVSQGDREKTTVPDQSDSWASLAHRSVWRGRQAEPCHPEGPVWDNASALPAPARSFQSLPPELTRRGGPPPMYASRKCIRHQRLDLTQGRGAPMVRV